MRNEHSSGGEQGQWSHDREAFLKSSSTPINDSYERQIADLEAKAKNANTVEDRKRTRRFIRATVRKGWMWRRGN